MPESVNHSSPPSLTDADDQHLVDSQAEFADFLGNLLGSLWLDEWYQQDHDQSPSPDQSDN
jgi:hypothetical protein